MLVKRRKILENRFKPLLAGTHTSSGSKPSIQKDHSMSSLAKTHRKQPSSKRSGGRSTSQHSSPPASSIRSQLSVQIRMKSLKVKDKTLVKYYEPVTKFEQFCKRRKLSLKKWQDADNSFTEYFADLYTGTTALLNSCILRIVWLSIVEDE